MPFGLKNVGETYQKAMVTLFHNMMHKEVEVYVDDMIAKGIELDPDKVKAIWDMPTPKIETEVSGFLGRVNYIA
ncbi:hypothetical protein CR513_06329, partial [Mucuna pruriens]